MIKPTATKKIGIMIRREDMKERGIGTMDMERRNIGIIMVSLSI